MGVERRQTVSNICIVSRSYRAFYTERDNGLQQMECHLVETTRDQRVRSESDEEEGGGVPVRDTRDIQSLKSISILHYIHNSRPCRRIKKCNEVKEKAEHATPFCF